MFAKQICIILHFVDDSIDNKETLLRERMSSGEFELWKLQVCELLIEVKLKLMRIN